MATPEVTFDTAASAICSLGLARPRLMTGMLRDWLTTHFSASERIEDPAIRNYIWKPNSLTDITTAPSSPLYIDDILVWDPRHTEGRPAILLKRNDWREVRFGIDDRNQGLDKTGAEHYASGIMGSHTLFCVARKGGEAETFAAEVSREMRQFGPLMRRRLGLYLLRFGMAGIGSGFKIEESRESVAVPVTVAYGIQDKWKLVPYGPVIKAFTLALESRLLGQ